jgi:hypothetical protein
LEAIPYHAQHASLFASSVFFFNIFHFTRGEKKRRRPRKMWMEGVQAAMTARNLEPDQWRNREEWHLVSGRRQQLLKNRIDR